MAAGSSRAPSSLLVVYFFCVLCVVCRVVSCLCACCVVCVSFEAAVVCVCEREREREMRQLCNYRIFV